MEHVSLSPTIDARNSEDALRAALVACLTRLPLFKPVDPTAPSERRLWRACELCSFLEYPYTTRRTPGRCPIRR